MELRVLGHVRLSISSQGIELRPMERRILAALAACRPGPVRYDALADAVWRGTPPRSARHSLQAHVRRIREATDDHLIVTADDGYRLGDDVSVDVDAFDAAVDEGRWADALTTWQGSPFEELEDWVPAEPERARLVERWRQVTEDRLAAAVVACPGPRVVADAERLVLEEPLRERRWALLMRALDADGRRVEALRTFDRARRTLASELGISPGRDLTRVHEALLRADGDPPLGNLPAPVTSLVGRESEVETLAAMLAASRIVTVTGPGGIGKSRLAVEAATAFSGAVSAGAWWVDLTVSRQVVAVDSIIGAALRVDRSERGGVISAIADREMLVVLDNCEHLIEAVAGFVVDAVSACPRLRILATSREPLGVAGERTLPVRALPVDGAAVELFVDRAHAADPWFVAPDRDRLVEISAQLDGVPLAIELVAARVRGLDLADLSSRLRHGFALHTGQRGGVDRHRTMGAALDWSHDLLDPTERAVFDHLAVFHGPFERDAVEHIVDVPLGDADVTSVLASLVDKSMISTAHTPGFYRLLEPVRQYAGERLRDSGRQSAAALRHARYYAGVAKWWHHDGARQDEASSRHRIDAARDNLRAAFFTAVEHGDVDTALTIPGFLMQYAATRVWGEPSQWAITALEMPGADREPIQPFVVLAAAEGAWQRGEHERSRALCATIIEAAEPRSALWRDAHRVMAGALMWLGRSDDADAAATASITDDGPSTSDGALTRRCTFLLIRNALGHPDADLAERTLADARVAGNATNLALALHTAGICVSRTDQARGVEYQREAAAVAAAAGAVLIEGFALGTLSAASADDDPIAGIEAHIDVMRHYLRRGNHTHLASFGRGLIRPFVDLAAYEEAAVIDGFTSDQPELGELAIARSTKVGIARDALGPAYPASAAKGAAMTDDEIVSYAEAACRRLDTVTPRRDSGEDPPAVGGSVPHQT